MSVQWSSHSWWVCECHQYAVLSLHLILVQLLKTQMHPTFSDTCNSSYLHNPPPPRRIMTSRGNLTRASHCSLCTPLTRMQPSSTESVKTIFQNTNTTTNLPAGVFDQNIPTNAQVRSHCPLCLSKHGICTCTSYYSPHSNLTSRTRPHLEVDWSSLDCY